MEENTKCKEVIMRMVHGYADLWFEKKIIEYLKDRDGVTNVDFLFEFFLFKKEFISHLLMDINLDSIFSYSLIEQMVENEYEELLKKLISNNS